jgi:diguanylate cyclase (GGDEF)-like protein
MLPRNAQGQPMATTPISANNVLSESWRGRGNLGVLLVSPDTLLILEMQKIFDQMGLQIEIVMDADTAMVVMGSLQNPGVVLLDGRLPGVAGGQLLATITQSGVHQRCAIALIADQVSDEWISRLREGVIDDIVPRGADVGTWSTHLNTMQRGHSLHRELEQMREAALLELEHDPLTGAFNREAMLSILFRETDRVQRLQGALCLVMFDVDDFGHWNQQLGATACDHLLREIAVRTGRILRSYDVLGRMGKDEFLATLPGCSAVNAVLFAERVRMEVFGQPFAATNQQGEASLVRLTASFGVASSRGRSAVVVLREVEDTLAQGKRVGPDSIRCAGEAPLVMDASGEFPQLFQNKEMMIW